jgi:hypothetical protein
MAEARFRYDPPGGPISGADFIDQTERAIAELSARLESQSGLPQNVLDAANQALNVANNAYVYVSQVLTDVAKAQESIEEAVRTAESALGSLGDILDKADAAYDLAVLAETHAQEGKLAAAAAQTAATGASLAAATAQGAANTAKNTADSAANLARNALGSYIARSDPVNLDSVISPSKYFLVQPSQGSHANLPSGIAVPAFLKVEADSGSTKVTQTAWDVSGNVFVRYGAISGQAGTFGSWMEGLGGSGSGPAEYSASIAFAGADNEIPVVLPSGFVSMYVYSKSTDVSATISLKVKAVGGTAVTVSESQSSPTDITSLAGGTVIFTVSGMSLSGKYAVFGVRLR